MFLWQANAVTLDVVLEVCIYLLEILCITELIAENFTIQIAVLLAR